MEALGVAASIVTILGLSQKVLGYLNEVENAPKERVKCAIEVKNLYTLLLKLASRVDEESAESQWYTEIQALAEEDGPLDQFEQDLEFFQSKLMEKGRLRKVGNALTWMFKKEEIAGIMGRMERLKSLVQTALEMDHFKLSQAIKHDTAHIPYMQVDIEATRQRQEAIQQGQETIQRWQDHEKFEKLMAWLSPINYVFQQSDIVGRRQEGTGQWFLDAPEFRKWLRQPKDTLFCPGMPGAGKTMVAAIAINYLSKEVQTCSVGVAYLYCNYQSRKEQDITHLLSAILGQLVQARPSLVEYVGGLYQYSPKPTLDKLLPTLNIVLSKLTTVYVVIDAVDELQDDNSTRSRFFSHLRDLQARMDLRLLVTSRDIPDIVANFEEALKLEVRATDEDVKRFVAGRIDGLPRCIQHDRSLQDKVQEEIAKAVDGMFLLAQLHVDSLRDKRTPKIVESTLSRLSRGCDALDDAYKDAIQRIQGQLPEDSDLAKKVLSWITCAERPLTIDELCCALGVEQGEKELDPRNIPDIEDLVTVCAGLIVVDEESAIIRLVHYTTQRFFERMLEEWNPSAQVEIASTCLTYLTFCPFTNGRCRSPEDLEERLQRNKFLDYATKCWGKHALTVQDKICSLAYSFLSNGGSISCVAQVLFGYINSHPNNNPSSSHILTGLQLTAHYGLPKLAQVLLSGLGKEAVGEINKEGRSCRTALLLAVRQGSLEMVKTLVERGADINIPERHLYLGSALEIASSHGFTEIVKLLLDKGANTLSQVRALASAVYIGHEVMVRCLVDNGAPVNIMNFGSWSSSWLVAAEDSGPIHGYSADYGANIDLGDDGADVDPSNCYNGFPLVIASATGRDGIAKFLIDKGAKVNVAQKFLNTPLMTAIRNGNVEIVRLLLRMGADLNFKSRFGSALNVALQIGREDIARLLIENGCVVSRAEIDLLPLASHRGYAGIVRLLVEEDVLDDLPTIKVRRQRAIQEALSAGRARAEFLEEKFDLYTNKRKLPQRYQRIVLFLNKKCADIEVSPSQEQIPPLLRYFCLRLPRAEQQRQARSGCSGSK